MRKRLCSTTMKTNFHMFVSPPPPGARESKKQMYVTFTKTYVNLLSPPFRNDLYFCVVLPPSGHFQYDLYVFFGIAAAAARASEINVCHIQNDLCFPLVSQPPRRAKKK